MRDEQLTTDRNEKPVGASKEDPHGRIDNSQNPALEQKDAADDISRVDQQEGSMEHGETGGGLTEESKGK